MHSHIMENKSHISFLCAGVDHSKLLNSDEEKNCYRGYIGINEGLRSSETLILSILLSHILLLVDVLY